MNYQYYNEKTKIWTAPQNPPVYNPNAAIGDVIHHALLKRPKKIAQIFADDETQMTFEEIHKNSIKVAMNLQKMGLQLGDIVTVVGKNNKDIASVVFGCFFMGAAVNTLDPSFEKDDLAHMFGIVKPKIVVCEKMNLGFVKAALEEKKLNSKVFIFGDTVTSVLLQKVGGDVEPKNFLPALIENSNKQITMIICSSGTTGRSKGVCLSHSYIVAQLMDSWEVSEDEVMLAFSSLYWITGVITLLKGTLAGATRIITEKSFTADFALDLIEKFQITHIFSPPSHLAALLDLPRTKSANLSSIRYIMTGGSIVAEELRSGLEKHLPNGLIRSGYGMTELCLVSFNIPDFKPISVGQPKGRMMIKIIDECGNNLGPNEKGQVVIKSHHPFLGYMGNEEETRKALDSDGWFYTGDIGYFDDDAFLFIVGRSKEIIKYKGFQISPSELEDFLQRETGIMQVCVVGVEDLKQGTDLPAAAILKAEDVTLTVEEIQKIADEKLPDYKKLRGGVYFFDEFPMTPSGKIRRAAVKEMIEKVYRSK